MEFLRTKSPKSPWGDHFGLSCRWFIDCYGTMAPFRWRKTWWTSWLDPKAILPVMKFWRFFCLRRRTRCETFWPKITSMPRMWMLPKLACVAWFWKRGTGWPAWDELGIVGRSGWQKSHADWPMENIGSYIGQRKFAGFTEVVLSCFIYFCMVSPFPTKIGTGLWSWTSFQGWNHQTRGLLPSLLV